MGYFFLPFSSETRIEAAEAGWNILFVERNESHSRGTKPTHRPIRSS